MSKEDKRATVIDVAKAAGVSKQTVSRVINNSEDVSETTRHRVQKAIEKLGFRPNALARNLTTGRSHTIAVVGPGLYFLGTEQYRGMAKAAEELGYTIILKRVGQSTTAEVRTLLHELSDIGVEGILWCIPDREVTRSWLKDNLLKDIRFPLVFLSSKKRRGTEVISFDNREGGERATRYLISTGCKRIAHIAGPMDWWTAQERVTGWRDALQASGLPAHNNLLAEGTWSAESGQIAMKQLLERRVKFDAIFAGNDRMALGALLELHRRGIRVPEDLAIIGFDNVPESLCYYPPLTTVVQNKELLGETSMKKLVSLIHAKYSNTPPIDLRTPKLEHEIIVRQSAPMSVTHIKQRRA